MSKVEIPPLSGRCLNCGYELNEGFKFCPNCSQKNRDSRITTKMMISDFFANYFSFDSRFGRTFKPFFLQPGKLTVAYMDGERMNFANPIRLYLVISLLHFFVVSLIPNSSDKSNQIVDLELDDETGALAKSLDSLTFEDADTISSSVIPSEKTIIHILNLSKTEGVSAKQIEEAVKVDKMTGLKKYLTKQLIKLNTSDNESISQYLIKNIPILMFVLLPVYALLLKLFFRKKYYIHHLIHSIHIHSLMFFMLTIVWIINLIVSESPQLLTIATFLLLSFYLFMSFRKNYEISKWRSFFTVLTTGILYSSILIFGLVIEVIISLLIF